jgi:RNA recognition motif-containing protein
MEHGGPNPVDLSSPASAETLKLFVGQVPRTMAEADLKPIFEEFGEIVDLVVLRDRYTQTSKGTRPARKISSSLQKTHSQVVPF